MGRMVTLQCAIVVAKLERFGWEVGERQRIGQRYNELLDRVGMPRLQQRPDKSSAFAPCAVFTNDREGVRGRLA